MPQPVLAVVSVLGKDQKGVVAQFATFVAERGINIEDLEQRVVSGVFVMDMLVDLKDMTVSLVDVPVAGSTRFSRRALVEHLRNRPLLLTTVGGSGMFFAFVGSSPTWTSGWRIRPSPTHPGRPG